MLCCKALVNNETQTKKNPFYPSTITKDNPGFFHLLKLLQLYVGTKYYYVAFVSEESIKTSQRNQERNLRIQ